MDQGSSFISKEVREFAESYKIKILNSSPYYAQANDLSAVDYYDLMMDNIDEVSGKRL